MTPKSRIGISPRAAMVALVLAVILLIGEVGAVNKNSGARAQQQPTVNPQQAVATLVAEWLGYLSNESVSGLASLYATQATLTWGGTVGIFGGGVFSGQSNVRLLYSALFENTTLLTAIATPVNTTAVGTSSVNATFGLELSAQRGSGGTFRFDINVEQEWVNQDGTWRIQEETWINNGYAFNAVTSTSTQTLALGPAWVVTPYPLPPGPPSGADYESCVTYSDFLYCIGGGFVGAGSYYAQLGLDGGAGPWKNTTAYPVPIENEACVSYTISAMGDATILCVGGDDPAGSGPTNQTYAAQLSPDGGIVGPWEPQLNYPIPISDASCVVDSGIDGFTAVQVICIGGDTGGTSTNAVYYAPVWQDGSGDWSPATSFPVAIDSHSCVISQLYIYCVGGLVGHSFTDDVYYAQVSSSGGITGGWTEAAPYPIEVTNTDCVTSGGYNDYAFCVGGLVPGGGGTGDVFYARLSHTGGGITGSWMRATSYNGGFDYNSCVEAISTIWCDWAGSITYDEILGPDAPTVTQTVTIESATATVTTTTTEVPTSATSVSGQVTQATLLPEVYGLFGIAVIFAVFTVFFATRRRS
jgi:hypothetical protein